jgi:hypothetical protein
VTAPPEQARPAPSQLERFVNIGVTSGGRQIHLGRRVTNPDEHRVHRKFESFRQHCCLIEATSALAPGIEWHWHNEVDILQEVKCGFAHDPSKTSSDGQALVVLECVNDLTQSPFVFANCSSTVDGSRRSTASRTARGRAAEFTPRRQRIATAVADWRRDAMDGRPAGLADWTGQHIGDRLFACGASRSEENGEQGVCRGNKKRLGSRYCRN